MTAGTHMLIVDDCPDAVDTWAISLRAMEYRGSTAADGAGAMGVAERVLPDLIVLDLERPGISGFEAARRLRSNPQTGDVPLIAATGHSHESQLDMAREAGFDVVVVKPCDADTLADEIERLLVREPALVRQSCRSGVARTHKNG